MFIYFIYTPSPIIEVEVLCTSPRDKFTAKKLKSKLLTALVKVQQLYNKELQILNTYQATYTQLHRLKKVYKKLHFKEHLLYKQGIQELKATKVKEKNSLEVELLAT